MQKLRKLGSLISLPMAALLVVFFFLPWLGVQCGPAKLTATGWQLTQGNLTVSSNMAQEDAKVDKAKQEQDIAKLNESIQPRPWFIAGLAIPAAMVLLAVLAVAGVIRPTSGGIMLIVLAVAGIGTAMAASRVSYVEELIEHSRSDAREKNKDQPEAGQEMAKAMERQVQEQIRKVVKTEGTPWLWVSVAIYGFIAICGMINIAIDAALATASTGGSPSGSAAPGQSATAAASEPPQSPSA